MARPLSNGTRLEEIIVRHPSLSVRSLHNNVGGGRQSYIMYFEGLPKAIAALKREYLAQPLGYLEVQELLQETPRTAYVFGVERVGGSPLDVAALVERHLGTGTVCSFHKSMAGSRWHFVTVNNPGVPRFLEAVARQEEAWVRKAGRDIPRYGIGAWGAARNLVPSKVVLTPVEETLLELALQMGYYAQPKECRLEDIAKRLKIATTTAHYRLNNAERKVLASFGKPGS